VPTHNPSVRASTPVFDGLWTGVNALSPVAEEVAKYLGSDLVFYRADTPEGLVAKQAEHWDPLLAWARETLGARFVLGEGVMYVTQPDHAVAAARAAIPSDPWRLGAVNVITTLTGSALIALALAQGRLTVEAAWTAAHVDEDWNMALWGRDEIALDRRARRFAEMQAAATVLSTT
jgi:chaperone required for assembly of F1-ATPase